MLACTLSWIVRQPSQLRPCKKTYPFRMGCMWPSHAVGKKVPHWAAVTRERFRFPSTRWQGPILITCQVWRHFRGFLQQNWGRNNTWLHKQDPQINASGQAGTLWTMASDAMIGDSLCTKWNGSLSSGRILPPMSMMLQLFLAPIALSIRPCQDRYVDR